jgi:hypothetical protein
VLRLNREQQGLRIPITELVCTLQPTTRRRNICVHTTPFCQKQPKGKTGCSIVGLGTLL